MGGDVQDPARRPAVECASKGHVAIIGDIRSSREAPDRGGLQLRLEDALDQVNQKFSDELTADFVITLGDEFEGLASEPTAAWRTLLSLDEALGGVARYGVGLGNLSTDLRKRATSMDGPCFHHAREAILRGKRDGRWVTVSGFGADDAVLNGLLWLIGAVRNQRTKIQRQTVAMARISETQKAVAEERGVSLTTVSKALKSALHEPALAAERSVVTILSRYRVAGSDEPADGAREPSNPTQS